MNLENFSENTNGGKSEDASKEFEGVPFQHMDTETFVNAYKKKMEDITVLIIELQHYVFAKEKIDELQSEVDSIRKNNQGSYADFIEKCAQLSNIKKIIGKIESSNSIIAKTGVRTALAIIEDLDNQINDFVKLKKQFEEEGGTESLKES